MCWTLDGGVFADRVPVFPRVYMGVSLSIGNILIIIIIIIIIRKMRRGGEEEGRRKYFTKKLIPSTSTILNSPNLYINMSLFVCLFVCLFAVFFVLSLFYIVCCFMLVYIKSVLFIYISTTITIWFCMFCILIAIHRIVFLSLSLFYSFPIII